MKSCPYRTEVIQVPEESSSVPREFTSFSLTFSFSFSFSSCKDAAAAAAAAAFACFAAADGSSVFPTEGQGNEDLVFESL